MRKLLKCLMTLALVSCTFVLSNPISAKSAENSEANVISLADDECEVRELTFDEMVESIALQSGDTKENVIDDFIKEKSPLQRSTLTAESKQEILTSLAASSYIEVRVYNFKTYGGVYKPRALSFYGEGDKPSFDHARMYNLLNIVFDRSNALSKPGYPASKQFSGNIYAKLESNDRIYYSIDGDFFNNGSTTTTGGFNIGVGESISLSFGSSTVSSHFAYIFETGRWMGTW